MEAGGAGNQNASTAQVPAGPSDPIYEAQPQVQPVPSAMPQASPASNPQPLDPLKPSPNVPASGDLSEVPIVMPVAEQTQKPAPTRPLTSPTKPKLKPRRRKLILATLSVLVVLLLGAGALAADWYYYAPRHAAVSYYKKLSAAKSAKFSGSLIFSSTEQKLGDANGDLTVSGQYDINDKVNPKFAGDFTGSIARGEADFSLLETDKTLFFKITKLSFLGALGIKVPPDWYKVPIDKSLSQDVTGSDKCDLTNVGGVKLPTLPFSKIRRIGIFDTVNGHRTVHYSASLTGADIKKWLDEANKKVPAECASTIDTEDVAKWSLSLNLWSSKDFDRLDAVAGDGQGSRVEAKIDTSSYDHAGSITAPAGAKSFEELFQDFESGSLGQSTPTVSL